MKSPHLKKWGGYVPHVPHQIAPMAINMLIELNSKGLYHQDGYLKSVCLYHERHLDLVSLCH